MDKEQARIQAEYFYSPPHYFWQWSDKGQVIEWNNGPTICYRDDLIALLRELAPRGLPPLGAVLLVLNACREEHGNTTIHTRHMYNVLLTIQRRGDMETEEAMLLYKTAAGFAGLISPLPGEYKTGAGRALLLQTIFQNLQAPTIFQQLQDFSKYAVNAITMLDSGEYDDEFLFGGQTSLEQRFRTDIEALQPAIDTFTSTEQLLQRLRTGINVLPPRVTIPPAETMPVDLLVELAEDPQTAGVTRLTQRLIAALKIPMHTSGSSDQQFGGVSDISNRGNFDRLLLSELAHDDLSLMARLANNEALYLRREELPAKRKRDWIILLDTTLRMWGLPRVFAVSAALACVTNIKGSAAVRAYALSGNDNKAIDLSTKAGVISALEQQAPALHCANALTAFIEQQAPGSDMISFLVTDEQNLSDPAFVKALTETRDKGGFVITVNRNGELHFYELVKGRKKLISKASFDLEELLFRQVNGHLAILGIKPFPFRYPAAKVRYTADAVFQTEGSHVFCITEERRLLHWPASKAGAMEIIPYIEKGTTAFGYDKAKKNLYILVRRSADGKIAVYNIQPTLHFTKMIVDVQIPEEPEILFGDGYFYVLLLGTGQIFTVDAEKGLVRGEVPSGALLASLRQRADIPQYIRNGIRKQINNGYSVLGKIGIIGITRHGRLRLDRWELTQDDDARIKIRVSKGSPGENKICYQKEIQYPLSNPCVSFRVFEWPDGSQAIIDSRGFMHLRSSDKTIPEISFALVIEKYTAFWAADGTSCGNSYFLASGATESEGNFYQNYIQRFIDALK